MTQLVLQHYARPTARRQLWVGLTISAVALAFAMNQAAQWFVAHPMAARGLQASLLAGLATGLGAIPVLFLRRAAKDWTAPLLGLAGGMMLAASIFSLLVPAAHSVASSATPWELGIAAVTALLGGAAAMQHLDRNLPHKHLENIHADSSQPNVVLVVAAIALHNLPEGLAVGAAAAAGADHGMTVGIAVQNIPEGWIVASAMLTFGAAPHRAALIALGTGLVEPVGGMLGVIASTLANTALPLALTAAAGAMLWVVGHEVIPASAKSGNKGLSVGSLALGFAVMSVLATIL